MKYLVQYSSGTGGATKLWSRWARMSMCMTLLLTSGPFLCGIQEGSSSAAQAPGW